jgi:hypothetical protein
MQRCDGPAASIYIRFAWEALSPGSTHFEQAFSADGAKNWEVNLIYDGTRLGDHR